MFMKDVESLREYAAKFAETLRAPQCVALHGGLGVGKTEFARTVIRRLRGADTIVPSPTFTLVQEYDGISHFDLYRIKNAGELEEIGFFDSLARDIVLVEWPEIAESFLPKNTIHICMSVKNDGREIKIAETEKS
ncbi:MAG: tRNA (adenosine(37)-N6)-threonylcarbamoyltransferase complex ATPase subunit type 1 TsaE [Rickettsiales bacterium]|jgi:tRNA threonylcarbamoyl adenosine modification protein YjeE|nr:tRNA (adenosine(37)-N6)-threonylcarbamoyltransferase complex ATPase subunit type 1 TsaE [Rickettsiales bacterium]